MNRHRGPLMPLRTRPRAPGRVGDGRKVDLAVPSETRTEDFATARGTGAAREERVVPALDTLPTPLRIRHCGGSGSVLRSSTPARIKTKLAAHADRLLHEAATWPGPHAHRLEQGSA